MRWLALILGLLFAQPAMADCTGCSATGAEFGVDTSSDYILAVGDLQYIEGDCDRWSVPADCGQAALDRATNVIAQAEAAYMVDLTVVVGDLTNIQSDAERRGVRAWYEALPAASRDKMLLIPGNHDANSTNCDKLWQYYDDPFLESETTSANPQPEWWERSLRHTRVLGISSPLIGGYGYESCQEPSEFYSTRCYGAAAGGGAKVSGDVCAANSECASLKCGDWSTLYEDHMQWLEKKIHIFRNSTEEALLVFSHSALCRDISTYTECEGTATFDRIHDQEVCTTVDDVVCGDIQGCDDTRVPDANGEACTDARAGYGTRTRIKAAIDELDSTKTIIWASGHVAEASKQSTPATIMDAVGDGTEYLVVEVPGAAYVPASATVNHGAVIRVPHGGTPDVVAWVNTPNTAPVIDEIGTAGTVTVSSVPEDIVFTGTDVDYGDLIWSVSGENVCMSFADGGTGSTPAALLGTLTIDAGCGADTYAPITVTLSDGDATKDQTAQLIVIVE